MKKIRRMLLRLLGMIPYGWGSYVLSSWYRNKTLRKIFCRSRERGLRGFLDAIGSSVDPEETLCKSLGSCKYGAWRLAAISRAYDKGESRWVQIDGIEHIEEHYNGNRRLIVINSHYGIPRIVPQILCRMGYSMQTIAMSAYYNGLYLPEWKRISVQQLGDSRFFAKDLFVAMKAIKDGKIFHTMADGVHGKALMEFPILGRIRGFSKSYAELALTSDADIVPVFTHVELSGLIKVKFYPHLDKGRKEMASEDRVSLIVQQYVSLLSDEYMRNPGSVHLSHMTKFLGYPIDEKAGDLAHNTQ